MGLTHFEYGGVTDFPRKCRREAFGWFGTTLCYPCVFNICVNEVINQLPHASASAKDDMLDGLASFPARPVAFRTACRPSAAAPVDAETTSFAHRR